MPLLKFDETNKLLQKYQSNYQGYFSYEDYFSVMDISDDEKKERIALAKKLEKVFLLMFALYISEDADEDEIFIEAYKNYIEEAKSFLGAKENSAYIEQHARKIIQNLIDVTQANLEDEENKETDSYNNYFLSQKRAMLTAANEANSIANYGEYVQAVKDGKNQKKWKSERDNKVRNTHRQVDRITIDIFEPFEVGDSLMMFPKDTSLGANIEEIANCRCTVEYSYIPKKDKEDIEE